MRLPATAGRPGTKQHFGGYDPYRSRAAAKPLVMIGIAR